MFEECYLQTYFTFQTSKEEEEAEAGEKNMEQDDAETSHEDKSPEKSEEDVSEDKKNEEDEEEEDEEESEEDEPHGIFITYLSILVDVTFFERSVSFICCSL